MKKEEGEKNKKEQGQNSEAAGVKEKKREKDVRFIFVKGFQYIDLA